MKDGLELDLRKPISVEKTYNNKTQIDVIQHKESQEEEFELLKNTNVKIIKQTKNEAVFQHLKLGAKDANSIEDDDFERMSNNSLNSPLNKSSDSQQQAADDPGKETITLNNNWLTSTKCERWIIIEGQRPSQEYEEKLKKVSDKVKISKRLNHIMERILLNIMKKQKAPK